MQNALVICTDKNPSQKNCEFINSMEKQYSTTLTRKLIDYDGTVMKLWMDTKMQNSDYIPSKNSYKNADIFIIFPNTDPKFIAEIAENKPSAEFIYILPHDGVNEINTKLFNYIDNKVKTFHSLKDATTEIINAGLSAVHSSHTDKKNKLQSRLEQLDHTKNASAIQQILQSAFDIASFKTEFSQPTSYTAMVEAQFKIDSDTQKHNTQYSYNQAQILQWEKDCIVDHNMEEIKINDDSYKQKISSSPQATLPNLVNKKTHNDPFENLLNEYFPVTQDKFNPEIFLEEFKKPNNNSAKTIEKSI